MTRYSPLLALLALPPLLAACDAPKSPLAKAKPGECYTVVGRDSLGKPTLAKTPCAASPDVLAAACPPPLTTPPVGCPQGSAAGAGKTKTTVGQASRNVASRMASRGRNAFRQATTRHETTRRASRSTTYRSAQRYAGVDRRHYGQSEVFRDYRRVYTPDAQELYGAPPPPLRQEFHADGGYRQGGQVHREEHRAEHHAPAPRGYAHREEYREDHAYARPLPPPPRHDGYAYREERREHYAPPPREHVYEEERYVEHRAPKRKSGAVATYSAREMESRSAYSYRESSSSSSSSYSSHGSSYGGACCRPGGHALPPSPFDHNGYLTWRGKTPG